MSSSGGEEENNNGGKKKKDPFSQALDIVVSGTTQALGDLGVKKNLVEDTVDIGLNVATYGLVGYDGNGLKKGASVRALDESVGEITGRNQARQAQNEANARLVAEDAERKRLLDLERKQRETEDISASFAARSIRQGAPQMRGNYSSSAASPERDFLGL